MNIKTKRILQWILIALLSLQFIAAGLGKFTGDWSEKFELWGYPSAFMYFAGVVEISGVIGLFLSKVRKWAIVLLTITMIVAAVTHVLNSEFSNLIHNGILIALLGSLYWLNEHIKAKKNPS